VEERIPDPLPKFSNSPRWSSLTKMVVAITFVAILGGLLLRFRQIVGPLLISLILAYLLYPMADFLRTRLRFSWRLAVTVLYLLVLVIVIGLLTLGGLAIVDQVQSLINFLTVKVEQGLPDLVANLSQNPVQVWGVTVFDFSRLDLEQITSQIAGIVQPLLTRTGSVVGAVASGAFSFLGWTFFSLLVSYFILADSGGIQGRLIDINIPGYMDDIERMGQELGRIWNAFLRGQLILMLLTILVYIIVLGSLRVNFYFGLALLAGLARFVPYAGPAVAWTTYGLVTLFQGNTVFGLNPVPYALMVVGISLVIDMAFDNYITPRLMGSSLEVHPAAVMIAAIISANLFGVIGLLLAAPVLATIKLAGNYALRKMFDQDPWADLEHRREMRQVKPMQNPLVVLRTLGERVMAGFRTLWVWIASLLRGSTPKL
jgi:predicted PurR-regulated permease PerM